MQLVQVLDLALEVLAALVHDGEALPEGLEYAAVEEVVADLFEELRLLSQLRSRATTLNEDEMASLRRIIGYLVPLVLAIAGFGGSPNVSAATANG